MQRMCWNGWTFTYVIIVGPDPDMEQFCTKGGDECTFKLNGTYLEMFESRLGLFQDQNCSSVATAAGL